MKFLVDNQLPLSVARFLASAGHDAVHVADLAMDQSDDRLVWPVEEVRSLISKDEDFLHLACRGDDNITFVWIRIGNCRKDVLLAAIDRCRDSWTRRRRVNGLWRSAESDRGHSPRRRPRAEVSASRLPNAPF
ncbi:MAG: DUF5615 family PIN-like protein [Planctomycetes bacterium]|nr:DUF5615 family PIN-like protein [Planctomycetota bacterium]